MLGAPLHFLSDIALNEGHAHRRLGGGPGPLDSAKRESGENGEDEHRNRASGRFGEPNEPRVRSLAAGAAPGSNGIADPQTGECEAACNQRREQ